jgi:hypothetical protein
VCGFKGFQVAEVAIFHAFLHFLGEVSENSFVCG